MMKPYWKLISASLSPEGRLLLMALIVSLGLSGSGSNAQSTAGSQEAIGDAEKLGACVATKVFFPPGSASAPRGCDYVLKLAAAGSFPGSAAEYLDKCCNLLTTEAKSDCFCPLLEKGSLLDAMNNVCKNGEVANLRQQCGSGPDNSQDEVDLVGKLGACVATKVFFPSRGAGEPRGCDYVLGLAAAGSFPATEEGYVNQCCGLLTTEATRDCICPLLEKGSLNAMDNVCKNGEVADLREQCGGDHNQDGADLAGKLGACVTSKVFFPPRGMGEPRGCDYVLKLAAAGSFPDTEEKYLNQCCELLTTEAESDCICPLLENGPPEGWLDAMDNVCKNGEVATLTQQCQEPNNADPERLVSKLT